MKNRGEQPINVAVIGGGYTANLLGAMDRVEGFAINSIGYANRSGNHGVALGREIEPGKHREVGWGRGFTGNNLKENVTRLLTQDKQADVILIAVPPHLTPGITRVVLDHSPSTTAIHVEKPVGLDPHDPDIAYNADTIWDTGRLVNVGHQWTNNPPYDLFAEHVQAKIKAGDEPDNVNARWLGNTFYKARPWWRILNESGGPLKEQGHPLHLAQHVLNELGELQVSNEQTPLAYYGVPGEAPTDVDMTKLGTGFYVPTEVAAELIFANGTPLTLEASGIHTEPEVVDVTIIFPDGTKANFGKRGVKVVKGDKELASEATEYPWPAFERQMESLLYAAVGQPLDRQRVKYVDGIESLRVADEVMNNLQTSETPLFDAHANRIH